MKKLILCLAIAALTSLGMAQDAAQRQASPSDAAKRADTPEAPKVAPTDAKNHIGEIANVCGKVVGSSVGMNGLRGHGFPVSLYIDNPEASAIFYFVAFSGESESGRTKEPNKVVTAYGGKNVCATGKILKRGSGPPYIIVADNSKIVIQPTGK